MSDEVTLSAAIVTDMTVGELEFVEEKTGRSITAAFAEDAPKGTALRALAYIVRRRDDPDFTWEQSADLRVRMLPQLGEENGSGPPTEPARRKRRGGS